jgi:hypothetical protein
MTKEELDRIDLRRFKLAQRDAMKALKDRDEAQERLDRANSELIAWRTIVGARGLLPDGSSTNPFSEEPDLEFDEPQRSEVEDPTRGAPSGHLLENKTRFVLSVIRDAGAVGKSPAEIRAEARKAGVSVTPGYPYSVLGKLKEKGEIETTAGGRYIIRSRKAP